MIIDAMTIKRFKEYVLQLSAKSVIEKGANRFKSSSISTTDLVYFFNLLRLHALSIITK